MTGSINPAVAQRRLPSALLASGIALIVYVVTCAPGVLWQDGATFQGRVHQADYTGELGLALAHPLYIFLARLFAFLPFGSFAYRVNLFSAVCGAATLAVAFDLFWTLSRSRWAAACATLMLGLAHTFWTHAVIAEVYGLYGMCTFVELWLVERFIRTNRSGWLYAAALVNGLSVSNHLLALLHVPAYGLLVIWLIRHQRLAWRNILPIVGAFVLGASPYWLMVVWQVRCGATWEEALRSALFGNSIIQDKVLNTEVDWLRQVLRTAGYFGLNFPTPLIVAAAAGAWVIWSRVELRWLGIILTALFCVNFAFAFRYRVPDQYVFFFTSYLVIPIAAAVAMRQWIHARPALRGVMLGLALLPIAVYEVLPTVVKRMGIDIGVGRDIPYRDTASFFLRPRKNGDAGAERYAREALLTAAPEGLLLADSAIRNPLIYVRDVLGVSPDVSIEGSADLRQIGPSVSGTAESASDFVRRGRAFTCDSAARYNHDWVNASFHLEPVGVIYRLVPRDVASD